MNVIREDTVRQLYLRQGITEIHASPRDYVTREAKDYIRDKRLTLVIDGQPPVNTEVRPAKEQLGGKFVTTDGAPLAEKPEQMTHLYGNVLVLKNHPRIVLRGKLDSLEADIILLQVRADEEKRPRLVGELEETLTFCRSLLSCEVTGKPLPSETIFGLTAERLREMSQNPRAHFGMGHILPSYKLGAVCAALNSLRARSRETELAAVDAFCPPEGESERSDLLQGLNRLSSAFYIMMCRCMAGEYK